VVNLKASHYRLFNLPVHEFPLILDTRDENAFNSKSVRCSFHMPAADLANGSTVKARLLAIVKDDNPPEFVERVCIVYDDGVAEESLSLLVRYLCGEGVPSRWPGVKATKPQKVIGIGGDAFRAFAGEFPFLTTEGCDANYFASRIEEDIFYPSLISSQLFLGSETNARSLTALKRCGITHIINCARESENFFENRKDMTYMNVRIDDTLSQDLSVHLDRVHSFIVQVLGDRSGGSSNNNNKILVHCFAGKSRSVSFVIYHLMVSEALTYRQALARVRECRDIAMPNEAFVQQLLEVERRRKDSADIL
jgi:predicted protein tyrosine phosphatase